MHVIYLCTFMYIMCACRYPRRPKGVGSLELKLQMVGNHLMWVLGTEPMSFVRAVSTFC